MVKITLKILLSFWAISILTGAYAQEKSESVHKDNGIIVLVKYKSKPEKGDESLAALKNLINEVKKEPNFIIIKVLVDPEDNTNILLYEEWLDEKYYQGDHMITPHLQKFMGDARGFLAGPPEITFWKLHKNYTVD